MLSATLRRYEDPERSADPRIYTLVSDLRTLQLAPAPRAHFRAELRSQLVAVAPRLVAEGTTAEIPRVPAAVDAQPVGASSAGSWFAGAFARVQTMSLGRPLAISTAVVAVFALLLGGAVWISKKALPGDALYSLKRANENVQLSLADGPTAKSKAYLDFAAERADEVQALLKRASALASGSGADAATISPHTADLVRSTLDSADSDVRDAARLLGQQAVSSDAPTSLSLMTQWAPSQVDKLQGIVDQLPAGALQTRAASSAQLVMDALVRADQLSGLAGCSCLDSAATDSLGPVPCQPCDSPPVTGLPNQPRTSLSPGQTTTGPVPTVSGSTGSGAPPSGVSGPGGPGGSGSGSGTGTVVPIPTLPIHLPTLPTLPPIHLPSHTGTGTPSCVLTVLGLCVHL